MAWSLAFLIFTSVSYWTLGAAETHKTYDLQLVEGSCPSHGRLEIYYGSWGTISNNTFSDYAARIACRQLGYKYGLKSIGPQGSYRMWLSSVKCTSTNVEDTSDILKDCSHVKLRYSNSKIHTYDVAIQCYHEMSSLDCDGNPYPSNKDIRLFRRECPSTGLIMTFQDHAWHDFCSEGFSNLHTLTWMMCKELGYAMGSVGRVGRYGSGYYITDVTKYTCLTNATQDCQANFGTCSGSKGIQLQCFNAEGVDCYGNHYPTEGELRLASGRCLSEGRLEISHDGMWGSINKIGFTNDSASVACKQMGYEMGILRRGISTGSGPQWLSLIRCRGSCYESLLECEHSDWATGMALSRSHSYDVGIACYNYTNFRDCGGRPLASESALALIGGTSSAGRLEIFHAGRWGTICDDSFNNVAATIACRQLGFQTGTFGPRSLASNGVGTTWLDDVVCTEAHKTIAECNHRYWGSEDCGHDEDVRISCSYDLVCDSNPCQNNATCQNAFTTYSCSCIPGFAGRTCEVDVDECAQEVRCWNGGTCIDGLNDYTCLCQQGYEGKNCSVDIDECESNPCFHGATCTDQFSGFTCTCAEGYKGTFCDTDVNECMGLPCHNGGVCEDRVNDFFCRCPIGFDGRRCDTNVDECASNPCQNNGTCLDGNNWYFCKCIPGYHGHHCEISAFVNECVSSPCKNNGTCIDGDNWYVCKCPYGYSGKNCQVSPFTDECGSNPCQNNGTCFDGNGWYACRCVKGFTGNDCQVSEDVDDCLSSPCQNGGTCLDGNAWYVCKCPPGISGHDCQITQVGSDICASTPCLNGGSCLAGDDWYVCKCQAGYLGHNCEISQKVDWCESNPCQNNGTCYDGDDWYICKCSSGYSGQQCQHIEAIQACASNPCRNGGSCLDGKNWFVCTCPTGYSGILCQTHHPPSACDSNPCQNNGTCLAGDGWYVCKCTSAYTGDNCQLYKDKDRCDSNPCLNNGTCYGGDKWFICQCPSGYTGNQCQTEQADECESSPCQNGGTCLDGKCRCPPGYVGNRCESSKGESRVCEPNPCVNGGRCLDAGDTYVCKCLPGYGGNNCQVTQVEPCSSNPCQHNGTCLSASTWYWCKCLQNYSGQHCEAKSVSPDHTPAAAAIAASQVHDGAGPGYLSVWILIGLISISTVIFLTYLIIRWRRHRYLSKGRPKTTMSMSMVLSEEEPVDEDITSLNGSQVALTQ